MVLVVLTGMALVTILLPDVVSVVIGCRLAFSSFCMLWGWASGKDFVTDGGGVGVVGGGGMHVFHTFLYFLRWGSSNNFVT